MKLKQLSIFLENKPGSIVTPCKILSQAGINLLTLSLADTQQFGILRIIVRNWEQAKALLEKNGCVVKVTDVLAVEVADRPGGLAEILDAVGQAGVNVEYMYAFTLKQGDRGLLVFRFNDLDAAIRVLQNAKITVIEPVDVFKRLES